MLYENLIQPPPLIVTQESTQDRGIIVPSESELFHQAALDRRLEQIHDSPSIQPSDSSRMDQTLNQSHQTTRKFNLNQFLEKSVYPSRIENSTQQSILDASYLIDHLKTSTSHRGSDDVSSLVHSQRFNDAQFDPNDTIVDEELILSLTQRASNTTLLSETLNENEHEVLDIFEQLEENEAMLDETLRIDNDSVLAPLSQRQKEQTDDSNQIQVSFDEDDSDDDLLNQFSMSIIERHPDEHQKYDVNTMLNKTTTKKRLKTISYFSYFQR